MSKPSAPAPPDYAAAAQQQGVANVNAAVATNRLNQADQIGPYGSLTYSYGKQGDPNGGYTDPQSGQWIPHVTATTTLSPEQQKLLDQNTQMSTSLNDLAQKGIGYVADASATPIDQSKLPTFAGGLAAPTFNGNIANAGGLSSNVDPSKFQSSYDFSGVNKMPTLADFQGQRDQITQGYMDRLAPFMKQQQDQLDSKLAAQGITNGSEAYGYDQQLLGKNQNDQRIAALLAGDQAQQNLFNNSLATRQQGVNEAMSQGNLYNAAQTDSFNQGLANANLANVAQNQQFGQNAQQTASNNQAQQAQFQTGLASGQFQNQARQQAIQEADYLKNQPLNMLNALRTGNQVTTPQFGNVTAGSQIGAAPIYQATSDQYNAALAQYKAQLAANPFSSALGALGTIGSAAIGKWG